MRLAKKLYSLVFACLAICFCFSFFVPNFLLNVYAETTACIYDDNTEGHYSDGCSTYNYTTETSARTAKLFIKNYTFNIGDKVIYSVHKENSNKSFIYETIRAEEVKDSNGVVLNLGGEVLITESNCKASLDFDAYLYDGIGTYIVKALIFDENDNLTCKPAPLTLMIKSPDKNTLKLLSKCDMYEKNSGEYGTYKIEAQLYYGEQILDINDFQVMWKIYTGNEEPPIFSTSSLLYWSPSEAGNYNLEVKIVGLNISNNIQITVAKDNTLKIIIFISSFVVLTTGILIISIVISIKKERVW